MSDRFCLHEVGLPKPTFFGHPRKNIPLITKPPGGVLIGGESYIGVNVKGLRRRMIPITVTTTLTRTISRSGMLTIITTVAVVLSVPRLTSGFGFRASGWDGLGVAGLNVVRLTSSSTGSGFLRNPANSTWKLWELREVQLPKNWGVLFLRSLQ